MLKVFLAGVVAIALLVAASVAILLTLTGAPRERGEKIQDRPAVVQTNQEGGVVVVPPPPPGDPGAVTFGATPPLLEVAPVPAPVAAPPPPPPRGSWEAVPITARAKALGRVGGLIQARLNDLQDDLRTCFTADAQARHGGELVTTVKDAAPMDDAGTLVLVLQLEGQAGSVRIVDAPVESRGPAGEELIACAQNLLRGKVLDVPNVAAGTKYRLLFPLMP